jgi:hypothetical protein
MVSYVFEDLRKRKAPNNYIQFGTHSLFKFELGWLVRNWFHDMVASIWQQHIRGITTMENWQGKIRSLRQHL